MNTSQAIDALVRIPKIEEGFIQHTERMQQHKAVPAPGAPGVWNMDFRRSHSFRVVLRLGNRTVEREREMLSEAIRAVLEQLQIDLLCVITELDKNRESFEIRAKSAAAGDQRPNLLRQGKDAAESIRQLRALVEFVS